jgi:hypothetical protein
MTNGYSFAKRLLGYAVYVGLLPVAACSSETNEPASDSSEVRSQGATSPCTGKTCGIDCTPPGADQVLTCDGHGACKPGTQLQVCGPACAGKACGDDCTPAGLDDTFSCDGRGACKQGTKVVVCG